MYSVSVLILTLYLFKSLKCLNSKISATYYSKVLIYKLLLQLSRIIVAFCSGSSMYTFILPLTDRNSIHEAQTWHEKWLLVFESRCSINNKNFE